MQKDDYDNRFHAFELTGDRHYCHNKSTIKPESIIKECTWCGQAIELLLIENRYRAYNEDRTLHRCNRSDKRQ